MERVKSLLARMEAGAGAVVATVKAYDPYFDRLADEIRQIVVANEQDLLAEHVQQVINALERGSAGLDEALRIVSNGFRDELGDRTTDEVQERILLSYTRGTVDILGTTAFEFNLEDDRALSWLGRDATYWIGDYHSTRLNERISDTLRPAFQEGLSIDQLRDRLIDELAGHFSRSESYWEGFATNVVTRSRTFGLTEGLVRAGATIGEFSAVLDDTTSGICRSMDGKIVRVRDLVDQRDRILSLTDPKAIKQVAPWRTSEEQILDAETFTEAMGYVPPDIQPPLHYHCRSTIIFRE